MQLRRFTSDSTAGALRSVREAFGEEAIILSNRQVDDRVEIIATGTLDEGTFDSVVPHEPAVREQDTSDDVTVSLSVATRVTGAKEELAHRAEAGAGSARSAPDDSLERTPGVGSSAAAEASSVPPAMAVEHAPRSSSSAADTASVIESLSRDLAEMSIDERPLTLDAVPAAGAHKIACEEAPRPDPSPTSFAETPAEASRLPDPALRRTADDPSVGPTTVAAIGQVLAAAERRHAERARRLERRFLRLEVNLWGELEPLKSAHLRQLVRFGIGTELAVRLIERLEPGMSAEQAMRQSLALLRATLPLGADDTGRRPGVTVLHGPAGGGKTTTLLKLAAEQVRRDGAQSVALVSADLRIGAFESLRAYGRLLGIPVVQARDAGELAEHLSALAHKLLVLVDHLPLERADAMRLPAPASLGEHEGETRTLRRLLVLPATLETRQFETQVARHRAHGIDQAVLTQLDRATRLATCFAPLVRHSLPVAYESDDARIQTPLRKADGGRLVATAMTNGREDKPNADEEILLNLLQPTRREIERVVGGSRAGAAAPERPGRGDAAAAPGEEAPGGDAARADRVAPDDTPPAPADTPPPSRTESASTGTGTGTGTGTLERIVSFEAIEDGSVLGGGDASGVIDTQAVIEETPETKLARSHPGFTAWRAPGNGTRGRETGGKKTNRTEKTG